MVLRQRFYNRFVRWARRGIWENLFRELARNGRGKGRALAPGDNLCKTLSFEKPKINLGQIQTE